jgi:translation initiation factor 4G
LWDFLVGGDDEECLQFLETLAVTQQRHWAHYANFIVAEVDGQPVAALCGYFEEECGNVFLGAGFAEIVARGLRTVEQFEAGRVRIEPILRVAPEHEANVWIVENVATLPSFRRRGLVDRLIADILDRGRARGATVADIGVLIGNDPAQRAYEKAGFAVTGEKRDTDFEALWRTPGIRSMSRRL